MNFGFSLNNKSMRFAMIAALALTLTAMPAPSSAANTGPDPARQSRGPSAEPPAPLVIPVIPPTATPPSIDGRLDDPIWETAARFDAFKTFKPDYGKEPSQRTEALLAYDPDNFYFAFRCSDTEPAKIKSSVCKRDAMGQDDLVGVILDTFNDNQSGFTFMLNPLGIQGDGIMNVQGNVDDSHDMVWYSKGLIDDTGWTVEARVPLQSIRFPDKKVLTMRIFFFRFLTRTSEQASFPPLNPDNSSIISQAQSIRVSGLKYKRVVEILPAFTYGARYGADAGKLVRDEENKDISLTGKVGLTSDLTMDGAVNPDFSQVEADAGQVDINLRYALYYQEKRPFFLEGQDLWRFGGEMEDAPLSAVVYTRTIIDPTYGFRLTGKLNRRDTIAAIYAKDRLPGDSVDVHPDFAIVRYKHSLKEDAYIGAFYTDREYGQGYNRVGGIDGRFRLSQASLFSFHAFGSLTRPADAESTNKDHALSLYYNYQSRKWNIDLGYQDVSRNFQVDTGFLTRTGVRRFAAFAMHQIYPKSKFFQKIEPFYWSYHLYDTIDNMWETMNFFVLRFYLPRNTQVRFEGILGNEIFAGGRFDRTGYGFRTESQVFKQVYVEAAIRRWGGIYYDPDAPYQGDETRFSVGVRYQPVDKLDFNLSLNYVDFFKRADGEKIYDYTILRSRNTFQVNKYLFFRGIVEYNLYRKRLTADALVSFTYIPGTVFYVGYGSAFERQEWNGGEYVTSDRFLETKRGLFFKVSYLWRF
jgi:hypothetical protein